MSEGGRTSPPEFSADLVRRLRALEHAVSPREIGEIWIFPPLADVEESAEFFLFTRFLTEDRRGVYSAAGPGPEATNGSAAAAPGENGGRDGAPEQEITEHGTVPAERVSRIVERFRRRLGRQGGEPVHLVVDGEESRWEGLFDGAPPGDGPRRVTGDARPYPDRSAGPV